MFILKERQCTCYLESQYNTRLFQAVGCSVNSLELKIMEDAREILDKLVYLEGKNRMPCVRTLINASERQRVF